MYSVSKRRAAERKGAIAKDQQLRELGIEPTHLSSEARRVQMRRPELENTILVYTSTGSRVQARHVRQAASTGLVPPEPINCQARPVEKVQQLIEQKAKRLAPCEQGVR